MLIVFMIARCRLICLAIALSVWVAGCNKVPLLAPSGSKIVVTTTATALPINGSADIIAQVVEAAGTPPQDGTLVTFITTLGTVQPSEAETSGGRVRVKFIAGTTSGTATIIATSGGATPVTAAGATGTSTTTALSSDTVKIAIGTAAVGFVTIAATPTTLPATGGTSTIAAVARDAGGNGFPGIPITFSTDAGTLSNSVVLTDQSGTAQTQLSTSTTATVTASAGTSTTPGTSTTANPLQPQVKVTVSQGPTITLGAVAPNPAIVGQPVSLAITAAAGTTGGAPIRNVMVNWDDGTTASAGTGSSTAVHTYGSTGIFSVTVTATDVNGNASIAQTSIQVNRVPKPVVGISATQSTTNPQTFTFTITATATAPDTIRNNFLEFGDGQSADLGSGTTATHKYEVGAGAKTAKVATTTANGATGTASTVIVVP